MNQLSVQLCIRIDRNKSGTHSLFGWKRMVPECKFYWKWLSRLPRHDWIGFNTVAYVLWIFRVIVDRILNLVRLKRMCLLDCIQTIVLTSIISSCWLIGAIPNEWRLYLVRGDVENEKDDHFSRTQTSKGDADWWISVCQLKSAECHAGGKWYTATLSSIRN